MVTKYRYTEYIGTHIPIHYNYGIAIRLDKRSILRNLRFLQCWCWRFFFLEILRCVQGYLTYQLLLKERLYVMNYPLHIADVTEDQNFKFHFLTTASFELHVHGQEIKTLNTREGPYINRCDYRYLRTGNNNYLSMSGQACFWVKSHCCMNCNLPETKEM